METTAVGPLVPAQICVPCEDRGREPHDTVLLALRGADAPRF
jgi:hypothetical protein